MEPPTSRLRPPTTSANPFGAGVRRPIPSHSGPNVQDDDEEGDEVAQLVALSKRTLEVQEESAASTARALQTALQAQSVGDESLVLVHAQGEQLQSILNKTDETSHGIKVAKARTNFLDKLSDSFLKPVFGSEKQIKPFTPSSNTSSNTPPLGPTGQPLWGKRGSSLAPDSYLSPNSNAISASAEPNINRNSSVIIPNALGDWASTEDRAQSNVYEQQIDDNLSQIGNVVRGLKERALAVGEEVGRHGEIIRKTEDSVSAQTETLRGVNRKLGKILNK
ncbi:uncharacterized protein EV422DRAFT_520817 [Fimicolochytrium jonesii]|uniref:uncharacterized protein n=1 Tax=Fimicolochytrium jonesii TaxID=1396493 RepID=UPI0022FE688C|nr:uncharacterized protein EV422DRAFT_520817 [Fimicolochytrium jonesii]KAI8823374.1 hypothetical protein EV422DRAFT_520817 [Fimicolochytrium jonesii]